MEIRKVMEHYEVFDDSGAFMFSADTLTEVDEELEDIENGEDD